MLKKFNLILLASMVFMFSCKNKNSVEPIPQGNGKIELGFSSSSITGSLNKSMTGGLTNVIIDIKDANNQIVLSNKMIRLININGEFISEPISLESGNYKLSKFLVADADDSVKYATPIAGSQTANLVNNPLDITFNLSPDEVKKIIPEVISTADLTAEDFGYVTFGFRIVESVKFLIGAFILNEETTSIEPTTASISVTGDGTEIYSGNLTAGTNQIAVKNSYTNYQITLTKDGYVDSTQQFSKAELMAHLSDPIEIILEPVNEPEIVNFFGFGMDGSFNSTGNTTIPSTLNGDAVVLQYDNFTLNEGHTFTVSNRCRGLVIYVSGDAVINGTITMTGKGAAGEVTQEVTFIRETSNGTDTRSASSVVPCGTALVNLEANQSPIAHGKIITLGAGAGGTGIVSSQAQGWTGVANAGVSGGNNWKTGGGGAGGSTEGAIGGSGAIGTPFCGGSGGGAIVSYSGTGNPGLLYGGSGGIAIDDWEDRAGGGAGYAPGTSKTGTYVAGLGGGGLIILFVKGNVTIGSSGEIESNGGNGGGAQRGSWSYATGGGAGGGIVGIVYGGTLSNNGTVQALGGNANDGYYAAHRTCYGGNGGNGSVNFLQVLQ